MSVEINREAVFSAPDQQRSAEQQQRNSEWELRSREQYGQQYGQQQQYQNTSDWDRRQREQNEVQHSSYTHTEVKAPLYNLPSPFISTSMDLARQLIGEGFQASVARISGQSEEVSGDYPQLEEETRKDEEAKIREQELLAQMFQKELERKTDAYRKQQEIETERIRKELEKQHLRDVEFRKELMEQAVENQRRQIELEAKYAKKELERERQRARLTLDRSKFHTDIRVNTESSAANVQSEGQVVSESEKFTADRKQQVRQ